MKQKRLLNRKTAPLERRRCFAEFIILMMKFFAALFFPRPPVIAGAPPGKRVYYLTPR